MAYSDSTLDLTTRDRARHVDEQLDQAVADSFPASDPVALAMPHERRDTRLREMTPNTGTLLLVAGGILAVLALLALRR